jgi:hypothetical protein
LKVIENEKKRKKERNLCTQCMHAAGHCYMYSFLIPLSGLLAIKKKMKQTIRYGCGIF